MPFTVYMPKLSPTMTEGVVAKWHKRVGDKVESGDVILEISTDKATVEHAALDEGYLRAIVGQEGDKIQVNDPIAVFTETADESIDGYTPKPLDAKKEEVATPQAAAAKPAPVAQAAKGERVMASPLAKKLAKERGVDLAALSGTGPRGRIMSRDLEGANVQVSSSGCHRSISSSLYSRSPNANACCDWRKTSGVKEHNPPLLCATRS